MPTAINSDIINLPSEKKTEELANQFISKIKPGDIIFLYGELGVGKTTFVRFLINKFQKNSGLEITEVTSPTFNLLNEYQINKIKINHFDLFRLKSPNEIKDLNLFDNISNTITLIEWPQIIQEKPKNLIELIFEYGEEHQTRYVQIKNLKF
jgi:tRNA threonylcarbamoyladenosine biosynthesis protein TsaE|tara:strand:- start:780 stop:1235 length:456 start_codon:yes stop_codon:yes gene_type:complete